MLNIRFLIVFIGVYLYSSSLNCQENSIRYNDTITKKFYNLKKDYSKRIFESTFYTIQIYFGDLKKADSILEDFRENYQEIKSNLIFETPNYKVRIGEYKDVNIASQKLEEIRKIYPSSFIIKLSDL
ncbi:MAG: SPOR domain-containing protein [Candidatus Marisimplicoccus sp.]